MVTSGTSLEFCFLTALVIFVVKKYKSVVYYLKLWYFYGAMTLVMIVLIPYFLLKPRNVLNFLKSAAAMNHVSKVIGIKWEIRGSEHLSKDKTCVIVANHQTSLDAQGMNTLWPLIGKMTVIAKRELLYAGAFGISMFLAGMVFIDRKSGGKAGQAMNDTMKELKDKKVKLWVFPEGTRRNTGEIHEFKKGAFHAAIQAQVPIVPVVFSSYKHFMDTENKILNKGEIIITALPEISTEGLTADNVDLLIEKTRNSMIAAYNETSLETEVRMLKTEKKKFE